MLFPADFETKIGFDQVRQLLREKCLSKTGIAEVTNISFSPDHSTILQQLNRTEEYRQILLSGDSFPLQSFTDPTRVLAHLRIENTFPEPEELNEIRIVIQCILDILGFFSGDKIGKYPALEKIIMRGEEEVVIASGAKQQEPGDRRGEIVLSLRDLIDRVLDEKAEIRETASPEIGRIRREIRRLETGVGKKMTQVFAEVRRQGWVDEETEVTVREGRLVIPMKSSHKRKIQGVVHDESATGQTVYIEPVELFEMNNEIRELRYAERREVIRILKAVADGIRPHIDRLNAGTAVLGLFDFIRAKALFALETGASRCRSIAGEPVIRWRQAVHPLLLLAHRKAKKKVVPLDIELNESQRILVISGPNAGGKSICLKTVGLLQYMLQCGLLPPTREDSEFGIFRRIMIDIGDEQSLENDLSTYTSKLLNMKFFLGNLDAHSLFLIDEMGSGTDPLIGGAIAEAALLTMAAKEAFGVVTTHYSNLKLLAGKGYRE